MQYRTYKETMLPQMVRLWKEEAVRIRYKAYDSPEEWKAELLDKPDFDPEGCILAFIIWRQFVIVHARRFDDKQPLLTVNPGNIAPGKSNQTVFRKQHIGFVYFFF